MKSVMISIKPYWVFLIIAKTIDTVEVRKTCPQDDEWNKVGKIYCTKDKKSFNLIPKKYQPFMEKFLGKVVGEFICDYIYENMPYDCEGSRVSVSELQKYANCKPLYGWHISNLVIYDEPKALNKFYKKDFEEALSNWEDLFSIGTPKGCLVEYPPEPKEEDYILTRPPQSWCYVENIVYCKDCKHLMFSDCYAECGKGYKGILNFDDFCDKGELR